MESGMQFLATVRYIPFRTLCFCAVRLLVQREPTGCLDLLSMTPTVSLSEGSSRKIVVDENPSKSAKPGQCNHLSGDEWTSSPLFAAATAGHGDIVAYAWQQLRVSCRDTEDLLAHILTCCLSSGEVSSPCARGHPCTAPTPPAQMPRPAGHADAALALIEAAGGQDPRVISPSLRATISCAIATRFPVRPLKACPCSELSTQQHSHAETRRVRRSTTRATPNQQPK